MKSSGLKLLSGKALWMVSLSSKVTTRKNLLTSIGPKVGKSLKIGFDHDKPDATFNPNRAINAQLGFRVQRMDIYCKRAGAMSRISGRRQVRY